MQYEMRRFVDENIKEEALLSEESGQRPTDATFKKMGAVNLLAMRLGPGKHLHGTPLLSSLSFTLFICWSHSFGINCYSFRIEVVRRCEARGI